MNVNNNTDECYKLPKIFQDNRLIVAVAVIFVAVAVLTFLANGTVLVAMFQTLKRNGNIRQVNNHNNNSYITKMLMLSMTFVGVLVGGLIMPLSVMGFIENGNWVAGQFLFKVRIYADYALSTISSIHVAFMALDTYLVVCRPLQYRLLTARTGYVMIAVGWLLPIFVICVWCLVEDDQLYNCNIISYSSRKSIFITNLNLVFGSFFGALFVCNWILYALVLKTVFSFRSRESQQDFRNSMHGNFRINVESMTSSTKRSSVFITNVQDSSENIETNGVSRKRNRSNLKCFRCIGTVLISFSVLWVPGFVLVIYTPKSLDVPQWVLIGLIWLKYLSSTINPIVYCSNKAIKSAVKNLMCPLNLRKK